jgi:hypothetical protein
MSKLDKNSVCEYCQNEMIASYRSKRFCSGKCRVYFGRENVKFNVQKTVQKVTNIQRNVTELPVNKELNKADMWKLMREGKI